MTMRMTIPVALMASIALSLPAWADGVVKTWVSSSTGSDTGTCQLASPCRTFAYAITQTAAGGEIDVKDAGGYGQVTINKAISIVSQGFLAEISVAENSIGITVNAGPSESVTLQGLLIDGHNLGSEAIVMTNGNNLTIENCQIRNSTLDGIRLQYGKTFNIFNTEISNTGSDGLNIPNNSTFYNGSLSHVNIHGSAYGVFIYNSNVSVVASTIVENTTGIYIGQQGNALVGESTISENVNYGIYAYSGGIFNSYGDNYINANGVDLAGSGSLSGIQKR